MFSCKLCETEYVYVSSLCEGCRRIKHFMNIYSPQRVYDILDNVLSRNEQGQETKMKDEIKVEIEQKQYNLRNTKQIKRGTEVN